MKWPWRLGKTCGEICDDFYDFIMGNVVKWCRKLSTAWFFASYNVLYYRYRTCFSYDGFGSPRKYVCVCVGLIWIDGY